MLNTVEVRNIKLGEGIPKICVPLVGKTNEEILEEAKLVKSEQVKQERYYSLEDKHVIKILDVLRQHVKEDF